jgi:hypothetical protein
MGDPVDLNVGYPTPKLPSRRIFPSLLDAGYCVFPEHVVHRNWGDEAAAAARAERATGSSRSPSRAADTTSPIVTRPRRSPTGRERPKSSPGPRTRTDAGAVGRAARRGPPRRRRRRRDATGDRPQATSYLPPNARRPPSRTLRRPSPKIDNGAPRGLWRGFLPARRTPRRVSRRRFASAMV